MNESFVPLMSGAAKAVENGFVALTPNTAAGQANGIDNGHSGATCAKPTVTLQRTGDAVTGIRVQCACGQVIELTCVF